MSQQIQYSTDHDLIQDGAFLTLPVEMIQDGTVTDFDLFVAVGGVTVLYAASPYSWNHGETRRLQSDGHQFLYYRNVDEDKVRAFLGANQIKRIDESLPPRDRMQVIQDVTSEYTRMLYAFGISDSLIAKGKELSETLIRCISEDKSCVTSIGQLARHDMYTYYHSGRVAAYAVALAMQAGVSDPFRLSELAIGSLLHDVGKSKVSKEILEKRGQLTPHEWNEIQKHPEYGHDQVAPAILTAIPREIVLHHHERLDGTGYPHGLSKGEILPEVQIVAFADVFDALTTNRSYRFARTKFQALDLIKFTMLKQLSYDTYRNMVELLGQPVVSKNDLS